VFDRNSFLALGKILRKNLPNLTNLSVSGFFLNLEREGGREREREGREGGREGEELVNFFRS
jgi:hypothetical protein